MDDQPSCARGSDGGAHHIDEHVCLDLIQGLLSAAERKRVLAHISDCPACERLFQARAAGSARIDATMAVHSLPDGEIILERQGTAVRGGHAGGAPSWHTIWQWWHYVMGLFIRPRYRLAGAVAVAVAIILLVLLPQYGGPPQRADLYMLPLYTFTLQSRDVADRVPGDLKAALDAYQSGNFDHAIDLLSKLTLTDVGQPDETIRTIFLGSALAWNGDYSKAAGVLGAAPLGLVPGKWGQEARWTLYVSLRESGSGAVADSLLRALAEEPGEIGGRARRVLESWNR